MKKIEILLCAFIVIILLSSCNQDKNTIQGEIQNLGNDTILIEYVALSKIFEITKPNFDTIYSTNDKFYYNPNFSEPTLFFLTPNNGSNRSTKSIFMFLKPEEQIKIAGNMNESFLDYTIKGSEFNNSNSLIRKKTIKLLIDNYNIQKIIDSLNNINTDQKIITEYYQKINKNLDLEKKEQLNYITNNLNKELSAYLLSFQTFEMFEEFYDKLSLDVKDGSFKNSLEMKHQMIQNNKTQQKSLTELNIGDIAPEFVLKSSSDNSFSLNSISDKFIVIDFWGTWCLPCVKGLPRMNEYYNKYKSKVEIIGIACNDNEVKWKNFIEENKLDYIQVLNNLDTKIDATLKYGVTSFPTKFILDKDKKIIARFNGESDDFYNKLDELMTLK